MRVFYFAAVTTTVLALSGTRQVDAEAPDGKTGLPVGAKAPDFKLKDQNGNEHTLKEFLMKGKVALVFYRSAAW